MSSNNKNNKKNFSGEEFKLPEAEERVLKFWKEENIFEKSLAKRKGKKHFVFFEGPPYANGKPGIHHVLARIYKDIILRYKTMQGYFVPRKAGWDTHGLPVEIAAEKALGLKSKKDIEKFGIAEFNRKAKEAVWLYKDEWENMTERIGYWLDLKNAYVTYKPEYIETLWWILKRFWEKKLLFKGHKVVSWCPRCGTSLSSHELAQGYEEVEDNSVYVKFRVKKGQKIGKSFVADNKTYILSWTTTPWTLPGNVALAVGKDISYSIARKEGEAFIVAGDSPIARDFEVTNAKIKGKDLVGLEYEPLFDIKSLKNDKSYRIYDADFVTTTDGTGVVHTAVMYGEDDYKLGVKVGLPQHHTVNDDGRFTPEVNGFSGLKVKDKETEEKIFDYLNKKGYLLKTEKYTHEYPFCWRCGTATLYYARNSWFIGMNSLRKELLKKNETINWNPSHLKSGRFGEWLREVKDWNLSRERYWGTPLPIWECKKCGVTEVLGSLEELSKRSGGSKNKYWIMRHGQSETQLKEVIDSGQGEYHLTATGRMQAEKTAKKMKKEKIDIIIASDILRTKETAEIVSKELGIKGILFDKRLREIQLGKLSGCHNREYHDMFPTLESRFEKRPENGESLRDLRARLWNLFSDMENKYKAKNILIVSHEYPIWMFFHMAEAWSEERAIEEKIRSGGDFVSVADVRKIDVKIAPRNETGEVDIHRPYVDEVEISCEKCHGKMFRVKEVVDVWFDSGSMPFAEWHYPFQNKKLIDKNLGYPADYISEGVDQTRGWFYTLLAVATALGYKAPYKNVISLGLINDKLGKKMSKSKGNIIEPMEIIKKYGVDAIRWYFYTVNPPGEPKNFDENDILKTYRRFHLLFYNSLVFYKTYANKAPSAKNKALGVKNILDKWILARLNEVKDKATTALEKYDIREAALAIEGLIDDLSKWYIRRSRRRLQKPDDKKDYESASKTLGWVLVETSKLAAPFTPFFAETIFEAFRENSIHLEDWPKSDPSAKLKASKELIKDMAAIRKIASIALAKRAEFGIKVRQPLQELRIKDLELRGKKELLAILADEVNVKSVVFSKKIKGEIELDTDITPELKEEGLIREIVRLVQDLRQKAGFRPVDRVAAIFELPDNIRNIVEKNEKLLMKEIGAKRIEYGRSAKFGAEIATKLDDADIWAAVRKI